MLPQIDAQAIMAELDEGNLNPLDVKLYMKQVENQLANMKDYVDELALTEAQKHGSKQFDYKGFKVEIADYLGVKYDYKSTGHPKWLKFQRLESEAAEHRKAIEKGLVALKEPETVVDEDSGEVVTVYPPTKTGKTGIRLTQLKA